MAARKKASVKKARKVAKKAKGKGKKCPVMDEPDPFRVYVSWEYTSESGGGICPGQEDDEWPSREDTHREHTVHGVFRDDQSRQWCRYHEREDVPFDPAGVSEVWVVGVTYGSGDTFGSSYGNFTVVGVYDSEDEAESIARDIRADDDNSNRYGEPKKKAKERFTGYKPWTGYFERLEGIEVQKFTLDEDNGVRRF